MYAAEDQAPGRIVIFTIGFTGKTAREFFETLREAGVRRVVDIRLNNVSQLAGFTKRKDLEYFLRAIADMDYSHRPELAPTKEILNDYKNGSIDWAEYERRFGLLLQEREPAARMRPGDFDRACLLCSEAEPDHCHRRLVVQYLQAKWGNVEIRHL